jgi:hypothetical protein
MDNVSYSKRQNGIYYTPDALAECLAQPLIDGTVRTVFDPAYGQGSLLLAAESVSRKKQIAQRLNLFGCDIHPVNGLLKHLPAANLKEQDFFYYDRGKKFDVILTNPPYVRHQNQIKRDIVGYRNINEELSVLKNSSDLWAYFLVKSVSHLHENGAIGAILPWAFIQADYSKNLRIWLAERFANIKILALNNPYFESADERVVLLWLTGYGMKNKSLTFAFAQGFEDKISYSAITKENWSSNRVIAIADDKSNYVFDQLRKEFDFCTLGSCSKVNIGIVTGANKYFIRDTNYCDNNNFSRDRCIPILTAAKEFSGLIAKGVESLKCLLVLPNLIEEDYRWFINEGLEAEVDQRSHSKFRKPWYQINPGKTPDAFFPYRVEKIPYLLLNNNGVQSTNSVHRIYFKELSNFEKKWIFLSMLSVYGQLSIAVNAKTYGRGMLKIEPGALTQTVVFKNNDRTILGTYNLLMKLLASGDKEKAVEVATNFLNEKLKIPHILQNISKKFWIEIKESNKRRGSQVKA